MGLKALAVDRAVAQLPGIDPVMAQRGQERCWPSNGRGGLWRRALGRAVPIRGSGTMLVLVQVSSIKTGRQGSMRP
jgi:hypothetical protein